MKLASAQELKQSLLAKELAPLLKDPLTVKGFAVAAESRSAEPMPKPTIALGIARRAKNDYRLAVRLQDRAFQATPHLERIRKRAKDEVDVRYIGRVDKQSAWNQKRVRPLGIGTSVGHFRVTAGTLGCFVSDAQGVVHLLSNNHVLADENRGSTGDLILQPGAHDGGSAQDAIAELQRFVPLATAGVNHADAALALVNPDLELDPRTLRGLADLVAALGPTPLIGQKVFKVGRTTGLTEGKLTAFDVDNLVVGFGIGNVRFDGKIEIEGAGQQPFSQGGDSGSLIVDAEHRGLALLFAGSDQGGSNQLGLTYANPLATVLSLLGASVLA